MERIVWCISENHQCSVTTCDDHTKIKTKKGPNLHKREFKIEIISSRSTVSQNTLFANMRLKVIQFRIEMTIVENIVIENSAQHSISRCRQNLCFITLFKSIEDSWKLSKRDFHWELEFSSKNQVFQYPEL